MAEKNPTAAYLGALALQGPYTTPMDGDSDLVRLYELDMLAATKAANEISHTHERSSHTDLRADQPSSKAVADKSLSAADKDAATKTPSTTKTVPKYDRSTLTDVQANAELKKASETVLPNMLDDYSSYTYHFRLYMMSEEAAITQTTTANTKIIVLAESGSSEMGISNVSFESITGYTTEVGSGTSLKFDIMVQEPLGATFIDRIVAAADELNIRNFTSFPYFLELSFRARNDTETGDFKPIQDGPLSNQVWTWPIFILNTAINVSAGGATYNIGGIYAGDKAYSNEIAILEKSISVKVKTVKDFFDELSNELKKREEEKTTTSLQSQADTFEFIIDEDLGKAKVTPDNLGETAGRAATFREDGEKILVTFSPGTSIDKMIDTVLSTTTYCQKEALATEDTKKLSQDQQKKKILDQKLWKVLADIKIAGYDDIRNDYAMHNRYLVIPYGKPTMLSAQRVAAKETITDQEHYDDLIKKQVLRKRYDYIYTGLNDQVFDFDMTFNFQWYATLPFQGGKIQQSTSEGGAQINEKVEADSSLKNVEETQRKNIFKTSITGQQVGQLYDLTNISESDFNSLQVTGNSDDEVAADVVGPGRHQPKTPDVTEKAAKVNDPTPVKTAESSPGKLLDITNSYESSTGRTLLSALMEQTHGHAAADMLNIELKIKGDPYWIEPTPQGKAFEYKTPLEVELSRRNGEVTTNPLETVVSTDHEMYILFRSFTPQMPDPESGLTPHFAPNNALNGVYGVLKVMHEFAEGQFTQTLTALRYTDVNLQTLSGNAGELVPTPLKE